MGLGYISVKLNKLSEDRIKRHIAYSGVHVQETVDLHSTLIYDTRKDLSEPLTTIDANARFIGRIIGAKEMGERKDGMIGTIALIVESPELVKEHERLKAAGYKHSYDDFIVHISLGYKLIEAEADLLLSNLLPIIGLEVVFSDETLKELED